jgi:radical SAM-linked protein
MSRIRILMSKRGLAAFIPHVELPPLISRSARRAGLKLLQTEGFSPHPRISLGPALPVGVPALEEPAEIWVEEWREDSLRNLNLCLPGGIVFHRAKEVDGPALSRLCKAGEYRVYFRSVHPDAAEMRSALYACLGTEEHLCAMDELEDSVRVVLAQPDCFGPGLFIKAFKAAGLVEGWRDLLVIRTAVGLWDLGSVKPLV